VAAARREITIDDILTDRRADPEIDRLSRRVRVVHDEVLDEHYPDQYSTVVSVTLADGRELCGRVDHAKGTPDNPMTADEILAKYMRMASRACGEARARQIAELILHLDNLDDVRPLGDAIRVLA
jgi:2-methylcitrate dehydratase PrpD